MNAEPVAPGYHAVVLAAGAGARFGGGKLLADWRGRPLIAAAVEGALASPVERVTLVIGADAEAVAGALVPFHQNRLTLVRNPDWPQGLATSLHAGLSALPGDARGAVVLLGDMPAVPPALTAQAIDALEQGAPAVLFSHHGQPAHPAAFSATLFDAVAALTGDSGARKLLERLPGAVLLDTAEAGAVYDVDRPEDLGSAPP